MKKFRSWILAALLLLSAGQIFAVRTVVFMYKQTVTGQDIFIKGGHDAGLVPSVYPSMSEPITYYNTLNTTTAAIKANDASLDWGSESALDWTTSLWPASWGAKKTYAVDGYGEDPENTMGDHWWKFDVDMLGNTGDWFEFKAFMRQGTAESWENNIAQAGTPYTTINHWGKKGYITKVTFGANTVTYVALTPPVNQPPVAALTATPATADTGVAISFSAAGSTDPEGTALQYQFDWENDGTYDTAYSTTATASHAYTTSGTKTVKVQVKDGGGLTATKTVTVTITVPTVKTLIVHYRNSSAWATPKMHWGYSYYTAVSDLSSSGTDTFGAKFQLEWTAADTYLTTCFNNGSTAWDGSDRRINKPATFPSEVWVLNNDSTVYLSNPIDATPPTVALSAPANGASLTGTVTISATASDNVAVTKVEFYYGTTKIGEDVSSPYSLSWNTALVPNGSYAITAKAFDAAGNNTTSASRTVTTANANVPPVANAGSDITVQVGGTAQFNATQSYDPNGSIVSYQWSNGLSGATPSKVYSTLGTYTVTLTVTDNNGATATDTVVVNVVNQIVRTDPREDTIYFVMTTRFYDGDPANNIHCWDDAQAGNPDSDPAWRGDFEGLIQKLDYIKALGFSAIWITPVVQNASGYDYHGYHALNFSKVDPRYKTTGDASAEVSYQRLINAAHAKGMKIIQDIVLNHSGNFGEENLYPLFKKDPAISDTTAASLVRIDGGKLPANYATLTPGEQYGARISAMKEDTIDTTFKYHHEKSMSWESYSVQTGQIAGDCVDLNTENPAVKNYLVSAYKKYIDMGVDGFRLDTVKHISRLAMNKWYVPELLNYAGNNFYYFGEVCSRYRQIWNNGIPAISAPFYTWKENVSYPWSESDRTVNEASVFQNWNDNDTMDNLRETGNHWLNGNAYHTPDWSYRSGLDVIDFPMHWNFNNAWDAWGVALSGDKYYSDATFNVTYVDSHDYAPDGAPENQRFAGSQSTWAENLSLMFTFRGVPTIYYGSEIEFKKGAPIDVGPNAPLSTTGRAYFGDNITGTINVSGFGYYSGATGNIANTLNHPLAKHIIRLNQIRRAVPALQKGQYSTADISGGMSFKRRYTNGAVDSFALVTVSGTATFNNIPNGTYKDCVTGQVINVTGGSLTATCNGKGNIRVFVLDLPGNPAPGKIGQDGTYIY